MKTDAAGIPYSFGNHHYRRHMKQLQRNALHDNLRYQERIQQMNQTAQRQASIKGRIEARNVAKKLDI